MGEGTEACDEFPADLAGFGLHKEGPSIHPLLAEFARGLDTSHELLSQFCESLAKLGIQTNHTEDRTGNYNLYAPLLPHVWDVAGNAEDAKLAPAGRLWNSLGYHISDLADYAGAKAAYERALKIIEKFLPPNHPNIKIVQGNLETYKKASEVCPPKGVLRKDFRSLNRYLRCRCLYCAGRRGASTFFSGRRITSQ